jgi:hypothetical protein
MNGTQMIPRNGSRAPVYQDKLVVALATFLAGVSNCVNSLQT